MPINTHNNRIIAEISTLRIYADHMPERKEFEYLHALDYTFQHFKGMDKDNNFVMYLTTNTFLIGCHSSGKTPDPLVFVNEKGEVQFEVPITIFGSAIQEFEKYIEFYTQKQPGILHEKAVQMAIRDYKNDKLDFYANNKLAVKDIIDMARKKYLNPDTE